MNEPSLVNESLLKQRLTDLEAARTWAPDVLAGLEQFIRTADDYDLFRVNPIQYAGASGLSEAEGIELFVHAAKVGLFEMDWLLICAYCPQVAGSFRELDQVHPRFQCEFCRSTICLSGFAPKRLTPRSNSLSHGNPRGGDPRDAPTRARPPGAAAATQLLAAEQGAVSAAARPIVGLPA